MTGANFEGKSLNVLEDVVNTVRANTIFRI